MLASAGPPRLRKTQSSRARSNALGPTLSAPVPCASEDGPRLHPLLRTWLGSAETGRFPIRKRSTLESRAVIGRYCSNLSRRPPAGKTCLSLTSRAVSSKATETPFTTRACPDFAGASHEVTHDESTERYPNPGALRDTLLGGRESVDLLAGAHDHARPGAGEAHRE